MSHQTRRGRLKIYFGYAPGVGKTYQMLEHARELQRSGGDVIIGVLEPHGRSDIREAAAAFERIPMLLISSRGGAEEMDVDAILRRAPETCVVDELAHSNVPGSPRLKR